MRTREGLDALNSEYVRTQFAEGALGSIFAHDVLDLRRCHGLVGCPQCRGHSGDMRRSLIASVG